MMNYDCKEFTHDGCPVTVCKKVNIGVPVTVKGFAEVGEVRAKCAGHKIIPGTEFPGEHDAVSEFIIKQKIIVEIPLTFAAKTRICKAIVNFEKSDCDKDDCDCDDDGNTVGPIDPDDDCKICHCNDDDDDDNDDEGCNCDNDDDDDQCENQDENQNKNRFRNRSQHRHYR